MNPKPSKSRVAGAFTLAAAFGVSGLFVAPAAFADEAFAPVSGEAYEAFAFNQVLVEEEVAGIGINAAGNIAITVVDEEGEAIAALDDKYKNVEIRRISQPFQAYWETDIVGGGGYVSASEEYYEGSCSFGFNGWDASGQPVVFGAGHCTDASTVVDYVNGEWVIESVNTDDVYPYAHITQPSTEPANGSGETLPLFPEIGTFEVSHFGGPNPGDIGNENNLDSLDFAVIRPATTLNHHPLVTTWEHAPSDDLVTDAIPVRSVGNPAIGDPIQKSGRTTGFTTGGTVEQVDGWYRIDGHVVRGFFVDALPATFGDSGGAVLSGNQAVGHISGGADNYVIIADIESALSQYNYSVMLYLDAPTLTTPADGGEVAPAGTISGEAPSGTSVVVTVDGAEYETVAVSNGQWSFTAPESEGEFTFTIHAEEGFNTSDSNTYTVTVVAEEEPDPEVSPAPAITSPVDGATVTGSVAEITGTGVAGATVTVTGAVTGSATVGADGTWSVVADLGVGEHTVSATQTVEGSEESAAVSVTFTVEEEQVDPDPVIADPVITSPENGAELAESINLAGIAGTGEPGAEISVYLNNELLGTATVSAAGDWVYTLTEALAIGEYTIHADQFFDGSTTFADAVTFSIVADETPVDPDPVDPDPVDPDPTDPTDPEDPADPAPEEPGDELPPTGADPFVLYGVMAVLALLGVAAFLIRGRKTEVQQ